MYRKLFETYKSIDSNIIDLSNISKYDIVNNMYITEPIELYSTTEQMKYFPLYYTLEKAIKHSPSNSVHLIVPGLMPASNGVWSSGDESKIYYMPNDSKPHHHGESPHHLVNWDIDKVYEMREMSWRPVENKGISKYRGILDRFNRGMSNSAIETWINWKIPHNNMEYPSLIVRKNSIIWWDFYNTHNLCIVNSESEYNNNDFSNMIKISEDSLKDFQTLVTIMNKEGIYYFVCSIGNHAVMGHKIKIQVI